MNKAVFLDRDGVINVKLDGRYVKNTDEFEFMIKSDVKKLRNNGFKVFVISNQPDIGYKLIKKKTLTEMHKLLKAKVPVNKIYFCPHYKN